MAEIRATVPMRRPPTWALVQRRLLDALGPSAEAYVAKYVDDDGGLRFDGPLLDRDGVDDRYECAWNWPLAYLLGGGPSLLNDSRRMWKGITRQLAALGLVTDEYEVGYDWFHQGEGNLLLYMLSIADPAQPWAERAVRFADFYVRNSAGPIFDATHQVIVAPHTGSRGPRPGIFDVPPDEMWWDILTQYGTPVEGLSEGDDMAAVRDSPRARAAMFGAMQEKLGSGDVIVNLAATSLAVNAFLETGDEVFRDWVLTYVSAWMERARSNGGLVPDNVGTDGTVGANFDGRWYGGHYGWRWPHGASSVLPPVTIAAMNAYLLSGEERYLDFARSQLDELLAITHRGTLSNSEGPYIEDFFAHFGADDLAAEVPLLPHRHGSKGWFENRPFPLQTVAALLSLTGAPEDAQRARRLVNQIGYERQRYRTFRDKEETGHEQPWLDFLSGDYPSFPEEALASAFEMVSWRTDLIRSDQEDLSQVDIHHMQQFNPVMVEALSQTIAGAPAPIYNGGLYFPRVVWVDDTEGRPGLPSDIAALVTGLEGQTVLATLVNLSTTHERSVSVLLGAYDTVRLAEVGHTRLTGSDWPGSLWSEIPPATEVETGQLSLGEGERLTIVLPPSTQIDLRLVGERGGSPRRISWRTGG